MSVSPPPPSESLTWQQMVAGIASVISGLLFRFICFGLCLGNIAMFGKAMLHHAYTPDLPWLINSGQYILQQHHLPTHDIFSWTFPDKPWTLYQWLFEVIVAGIQNLLGEAAMMRAFVLLGLLIYVGIPYVKGISEKIPLVFTMPVASAALYAAAVNLGIRPMVVTIVFLALQYVLLEETRKKRIARGFVFAAIALIYVLWGNMHTGVVLGLLSLGLWALGDFMESRRWYVFQPTLPDIEGEPLGLKFYAGLTITGFLASLLNPYGIGIYSYLADLASQGFLNDAIVELQSPDFHVMNYWYFAGFIGLFALMMSRPRQVFSAQALLHLSVFTWMTLGAQRFVVWACIFYALILPKALYQWWLEVHQSNSLVKQTVLDFERYKPLFAVTLSMAAMAFLFFPAIFPPDVVTVNHIGCEGFFKGIDAYQEKYRQPGDHVLTEPEIGSCSLIHYPSDKVFFDTRFDFYGQRFTQRVRETSDLQGDWKGNLRQWKINVIFLSKRWPLANLLAFRPEYRRLYEDADVVIYRKAGVLQSERDKND